VGAGLLGVRAVQEDWLSSLPWAAAAFGEADAPVVVPPPVALVMVLLGRLTATSLTPHMAFSMPCNPEPLI